MFVFLGHCKIYDENLDWETNKWRMNAKKASNINYSLVHYHIV